MARQKLVDGVVRDYTPEEEAAADAEAARVPTTEENNARLLAEIRVVQDLALRALVEDTDTVWLDKRRAAIVLLRDQIVK